MSLEDYLNNKVKIFSENRYIELKKALLEYADKNENQIEDTEEKKMLRFDYLDISKITKDRKDNHDDYLFYFDKNEKKVNTIEEFIQLNSNKTKQINKNNKIEFFWQAKYSYSLNFIALFVYDFYSSSRLESERYIECANSEIEKVKILKFFLAELYELAANTERDWSASVQILSFEQKVINPVFNCFPSALSLFYKLIINGFDFADDRDRSSEQPRYRNNYKLRSFEILLESLEEYKPESAMKLMSIIVADFASFSSFLANSKYVLTSPLLDDKNKSYFYFF